MKTAYRAIAYLIAGLVAAQAAFIAFAWFTVISQVEDGTAFTENSEGNAGHALHSIGALTILALVVALLLTSFFTKTKGASKRACIVVGVVVAQVAFAIVAFSAPVVGLLHGVNAVVLLGAAVHAARRMTAAMSTPGDTTAAGATVPAQARAADEHTAV